MVRKRIVIDPGHGGDDPGAVNDDTHEADVALKIAQALKAIFDSHPGYDAVMTRYGNVTTDLDRRIEIANDLDATLVSIHVNAASDPRANGAEVWCFADKDKDGKETEGHRLAASVQRELVGLDFHDRGARVIYSHEKRAFVYRKLRVLIKTKRPAILAECGFITNPDDVKRLSDPHGDVKERLALAIFRGVAKTGTSNA